MADISLQTISDNIALLSQSLEDFRLSLSSVNTRLVTDEANIILLLNPPVVAPPQLVAWLNVPNSITDIDSTLSTRLGTDETNIATNTSGIATLTTNLATETSNRTTGDNNLQADIADLQTQITTNLATLTQEISDRGTLATSMSTQYSTLNTRIDNALSDLSTQTSAANVSINSINSQVATINSALQTAQTQIQLLQGIGVDPSGAQASQIVTLTSIANDAESKVTQEILDRKNGDVALQNSINGFSASISDISANLSSETAARISADNSINSQITTINTSISGFSASLASETAARIAADNTLTANVAANTTNISTNASNIANEITNRTTADTGLQTQITTNTGNISTNTTNIAANTSLLTTIRSNFGVVKDGGGYITGSRVLDNSLASANFYLRNLNNDLRLQNPGYVGKYFIPISVCAFSLPVSYDTAYGTAPATLFHGTNGNDYSVNVNVYATASVGINGSVFKGVDYSTGGDTNRLGQVLTTFKVTFRGGVNRYLSLWYRLKNTPTDTTQRWYPVSLADNTMSGQRTYEQVSKEDVVQISVTSNMVIEFGLTILNTLDASIADATKTFIYGGSVTITALNMVTVS